MSKENIEAAARRLRNASQSKITCQPVRDLIGENDTQKAYVVQEINTNLRLEEGARIVGSKIGLTSLSVQKQLGVDQPDFGMLFNDKEVLNGGEISVSELMQPKAEAEIAFVLGKDLTMDNLSEKDMLSAIDHAMASIEIVGSRIDHWNIKITDTIADNASASHFVVSDRPVKPDKFDMVNCKMVMEKNNQKVSEGTGSACMGSPVNAVLWLAKTMNHLGKPLKAGDIILSGALGPMVNVVAGDHITANIEGLGSVSVHFKA